MYAGKREGGWITAFGLDIVNYGLDIVNYGLDIVNYGLAVPVLYVRLEASVYSTYSYKERACLIHSCRTVPRKSSWGKRLAFIDKKEFHLLT